MSGALGAAGPYILAIDQGTTSTRCILFDAQARQVAVAQEEFRQIYPRPGWVEHDPEEIWRDVVKTLKAVLEDAGVKASDVAAIGVTNQRETVVVWDRKTGKPVHNAIVWQDRRTAEACAALKAQGKEAMVTEKTGLILDPYFSAPKLAWVLDNVHGVRAAARRGELAFGTIDCFLLWRLTGGKAHASDPTNAGRTLLFNIATQDWDDELLDLFDAPKSLLPTVLDNSGEFGVLDEAILGSPIPIAGMAGDQQAALFGQACFREGMTKSTYGTGCFLLMNTGRERRVSKNRMLTTPAYRLKGETTYALEGSIFVAGAAVKWLRDAMGLIEKAGETRALAESLQDDHGVYMVPAFVGLGAPHWEPQARGLICGLTLDSTAAHLARAALEAVAYQTLDLTEAMARDAGGQGAVALRVDGGMAANDWMCQFLADILQAPVERPSGVETTALGAAFLAGLAVGVWEDLDAIAKTWSLDHRFEPKRSQAQRGPLVAGWNTAVKRALVT